MDGIEYQNGSFEAIYHAEGRVIMVGSSLKYEYALKDHLGNTRLMFMDKNADGVIKQSILQSVNEVSQENHYYAFGMAMEGNWMNTPSVLDNKYTYNGKELNEDFGLGWLDYWARQYDAALGRWVAVDPMAEKAPNMTPYRYGFNNPMRYIDPNGMFEYSDGYGTYDSKNATSSIGFSGTYQNGGGEVPEQEESNTAKKDGDEPIAKDYKGKKETAPADKGYNCHSYAWDNSKGDPSDPANSKFVKIIPGWDNDPLNNTDGYKPLDFNEPNVVGDRVIYFSSNELGNVVAQHSGIVTKVNDKGSAIEITSKWGSTPMYQHHPRDVPSGYSSPEPTFKVGDKTFESRVYFRNVAQEYKGTNLLMKRDNTSVINTATRLTTLPTYIIKSK